MARLFNSTNVGRFFDNEHLRIPGESLYDDVFTVPGFVPLQRKNELREMIDLARQLKPMTVGEIGADKGGGLYHWCKCLPTVKRVIACEITGLPYAAMFEKAFPHISFFWMEGSSRDSKLLNKLSAWLKENPIDVLFIDGDKDGFLADFNKYRQFMAHPGLVFMHDITSRSRPAFARIRKRKFRTSTIIRREESKAAVERMRRGIPSTGPYESWLRHWKGRSAGVGVIHV